MAFTPVPTVTDGDDLLDDWGNAASAAVTELQTIRRFGAAGAAVTTSGTTRATVATIAVPTLTVAGSLIVWCQMYRTQTVTTDAFDVYLSSNGVVFGIYRQTGAAGVDAAFHNVVAVAAGAGPTITAEIERIGGTGTASVSADVRFNRLDALFIPAP